MHTLSVVFAIHGIPDTVIFDNGLQYAIWQFRVAKDQGLTLPPYPQSNVEVESAVQTTKNIQRMNANVYLG